MPDKPDNSNTSDDKSCTFYNLLVEFVKMKEGRPHNTSYFWSFQDIQFIVSVIKNMSPARRAAFKEQFKDYQIAKVLSIE